MQVFFKVVCFSVNSYVSYMVVFRCTNNKGDSSVRDIYESAGFGELAEIDPDGAGLASPFIGFDLKSLLKEQEWVSEHDYKNIFQLLRLIPLDAGQDLFLRTEYIADLVAMERNAIQDDKKKGDLRLSRLASLVDAVIGKVTKLGFQEEGLFAACTEFVSILNAALLYGVTNAFGQLDYPACVSNVDTCIVKQHADSIVFIETSNMGVIEMGGVFGVLIELECCELVTGCRTPIKNKKLPMLSKAYRSCRFDNPVFALGKFNVKGEISFMLAGAGELDAIATSVLLGVEQGEMSKRIARELVISLRQHILSPAPSLATAALLQKGFFFDYTPL